MLACFAASSQAAPKAELQELRGRIASLQKELDSAEDARTDATDALRESEQAISEINGALRDLDAQQHQANEALAHLQVRTREVQQRIGSQQAALSRLLHRQYVQGGQDQLRILLNRQDPNQSSRHLRYYTYLSRSRTELLQDLRQNLGQVRQLAAQAQDRRDELAKIKSDRDAQKQRLLTQQDARKKLVQQLARKIGQQRQEISQLQRDEKRLTRLIERLAKIVPKKTPPPAAPGRAAPPPTPAIPTIPAGTAFQRLKGTLPLPLRGELAGRFGSPRHDTGSPWRGLFIRSSPGREVKAVAGGRVVFADWLRGFGNLMIVDHGEGFMSLYGNNEALYRRVGDDVRGGETVALVGNSGGNPETGLYFEMRYQSKPFDPLTWCKHN